ncbi:MAG: exopolysaccharide biosynthesis polyprenyl glycosylphosphotransferase [Lachnospiraceae bacterium]|nr:exopolysaccharide biosynthesis polyprenyl glycosylphosphotransferase [Lachnospiraceae bacterium]
MTEERTKKSSFQSIKKLFALELPLVGWLLDIAIYGWFWLNMYYEPRIRYTIKLYFRGHILVLLIYAVLLYFLLSTYDGFKIGHLKPFDVILSQAFALIIVNVFSYFQMSLMANWLVRVGPMLWMTILQILVSILWVKISDLVYKKVFPPRRLLLLHGDKPIEGILHKFASRPDKYRIEKTMDIREGIEKVKEVMKEEEGIVIWDIPTADRNRLMKYCYEHEIRMYTMPKIPDVLMSGATKLHLFDTPLYMTREYALSFGQRFWKRMVDIVCSVLLLVIASPIMLVTAILIRLYDGGPVFYKQTRCTLNQKEFEIIKFRSMRVDAEKDGVARLATEHDDRITPIGRFIRKVRIDELPQLINIVKGEMSFIGPRPERPEIIREYVKTMPEFVYRMKVKAGLAGYAQIYGKYNTTPYDKLKLDLTYIQNYSFWLDIKLMLLTLRILLTPESTEGFEEGTVPQTLSELELQNEEHE